jgi:hypothetical protein
MKTSSIIALLVVSFLSLLVDASDDYASKGKKSKGSESSKSKGKKSMSSSSKGKYSEKGMMKSSKGYYSGDDYYGA